MHRVAEELEACRVGRARVLRARHVLAKRTSGSSSTLQHTSSRTLDFVGINQYRALKVEIERQRNHHGARAAFGELSSYCGIITASEEMDTIRQHIYVDDFRWRACAVWIDKMLTFS
jgi:hypothetical protein